MNLQQKETQKQKNNNNNDSNNSFVWMVEGRNAYFIF